MNKNTINWYEKCKFTNPIMIMGFEGWPDAGKTASMAAIYMIEKLNAKPIGEINPEGLFNYQTSNSIKERPQVIVQGGLVKTLKVRTTYLWSGVDCERGKDIIISLGPEPDLNWNRYAGIIIELVEKYSISKIFTLGGTFAPIPHTMGSKVSAVVSNPELNNEINKYGIEPASYEGPTSIHSQLMVEAAKNNVPMINLWSHTPHYIRVVDYIGRYNLMLNLCRLSNLNVELGDAIRDAEFLLNQINNVLLKKPELRKYLNILENEYLKSAAVQGNKGINVSNKIYKQIEEILKENNL
jgi:proteasome assembly chaperone (PAC2) family protein